MRAIRKPRIRGSSKSLVYLQVDLRLALAIFPHSKMHLVLEQSSDPKSCPELPWSTAHAHLFSGIGACTSMISPWEQILRAHIQQRLRLLGFPFETVIEKDYFVKPVLICPYQVI
ncbi:unnamed protein product [Kuraishia capsulata CBS 1993]|uniref:Uncharacterized protein n=1 Tax=Kuraishia capsulata CBS 1993 TaxID=1382522 RepID=W6MST7_9ASCO|nr:uncharacterized protein KUCA_T00004269001 [Kuraishia capsulata CBS 1993]CDK28287.1 unnamed protein product [Kuraishia capsulata CBS 1993]